MKKGIHPEYREVLFRDISTNVEYLTRSTVQTQDKAEHNGKEYPLVKLEISSSSHPFYTGQQRLVDSEGRVERFKKRYANVKRKK